MQFLVYFKLFYNINNNNGSELFMSARRFIGERHSCYTNWSGRWNILEKSFLVFKKKNIELMKMYGQLL